MQHEESDFTLILIQRRIVVFLEGGHAEMQMVEAGAAIIVDLWGYEYVMKKAMRIRWRFYQASTPNHAQPH
jgi:hypothetical protein